MADVVELPLRVQSVEGHLAFEVAQRKQSEQQLWHAYSRLADSYQELVLQFAWLRRRQWIILLVCCFGQLACWILGALFFRLVAA